MYTHRQHTTTVNAKLHEASMIVQAKGNKG